MPRNVADRMEKVTRAGMRDSRNNGLIPGIIKDIIK
jgi:hypothetical protein